MKPIRVVNPGETYGWLTVLGDAPKDKYGHYRVKVRCRCGNENEVQKSFLFKENCKCLDCSIKYRKPRTGVDVTGQTINNWYVIRKRKHNDQGVQLYECRCNSCNNTSLKTKSQMKLNKSGKCENCTPDFNFVIKGASAIGTLPDGCKFTIDAEDIPRVNSRWWHTNSNYIVDPDGVKLHRFLLNCPDGYLVDHINRNTSDYRKSNLRIVNCQQNSMNRSLMTNSTTGYVGVSYVKSKKLYRAQIGINNRDISLGRNKDPIICAQMYNIASSILFGEFKGHHNDVPEPDMELKIKIETKLQPYMAEAELATQSCGLFLCREGA